MSVNSLHISKLSYIFICIYFPTYERMDIIFASNNILALHTKHYNFKSYNIRVCSGGSCNVSQVMPIKMCDAADDAEIKQHHFIVKPAGLNPMSALFFDCLFALLANETQRRTSRIMLLSNFIMSILSYLLADFGLECMSALDGKVNVDGKSMCEFYDMQMHAGYCMLPMPVLDFGLYFCSFLHGVCNLHWVHAYVYYSKYFKHMFLDIG